MRSISITLCVVITFMLCISLVQADKSTRNNTNKSTENEPSWWKIRNNNIDLYYPHNAHAEIMEHNGDSCLLCHSFNKNTVTNKQKLKKITTISNEPLMGVCHSCHVEERTAISECSLCHTNKKEIWPQSHNLDYLNHHGEDVKSSEKQCDSCHLEITFCTDCHFKRRSAAKQMHPLGYLGRHGLEVRSSAMDCGRCHNPSYCSDCHGRKF